MRRSLLSSEYSTMHSIRYCRVPGSVNLFSVSLTVGVQFAVEEQERPGGLWQLTGGEMAVGLQDALEVLRTHEADLRRLGVTHAAVFGSVARGEALADSDIDVLVELDAARPIGIFEYARLKLFIGQLFNGAGDVVNRRTLKPLLRGNILRDAVDAF